ncbi:MAG: hypothetical protein GY696_15585 [Gammaproteobacteria bacterium]|nr:hypothetical protein [Gammaproteobacteria bacterium]
MTLLVGCFSHAHFSLTPRSTVPFGCFCCGHDVDDSLQRQLPGSHQILLGLPVLTPGNQLEHEIPVELSSHRILELAVLSVYS